MGIHLHEHILNLRADLVESGHENWMGGAALTAWSWFWTRPWAYSALAEVGRIGLGLFSKERADGTQYVDNLPSIGAAWTGSRTFPMIAQKRFRERWAELQAGGEAK